MSMILGCDRTPVARKKHQCCFCGCSINAGEKYLYRTGVSVGDFWSMKMHRECNDYAEINLTDDDYECFETPMFKRPMTAFDPQI
jgi:hypothetical protein